MVKFMFITIICLPRNSPNPHVPHVPTWTHMSVSSPNFYKQIVKAFLTHLSDSSSQILISFLSTWSIEQFESSGQKCHRNDWKITVHVEISRTRRIELNWILISEIFFIENYKLPFIKYVTRKLQCQSSNKICLCCGHWVTQKCHFLGPLPPPLAWHTLWTAPKR